MKDELIRVLGYNNAKTEDTIHIAGQYVPVNATVIPLKQTATLKVGDKIRIVRPSTAGWLSVLGTDRLGNEQEYNFSKWTPGRHDMVWERTVVAVTSESITIDVPLTMSLDPKYGGGYILPLSWTGRINNVGIENLCCDSEYDHTNLKDENHRWQAITFNHVKDGWVRRVEAHHFAGSAVMVLEGAMQVTVEDCKFLYPVSEIANHRRYAFHTLGQLTLFQRCYSEEGYRDFTVGVAVPGPNAFVQCHSERPYSFSGSTGGFSNGILMDKITVSGGIIQLGYRDMADQGAGWVAANSMCCGRDELHRLIVLLLLQLIIGLMECGRNLLVMAIMNCRILLSSRKVFFMLNWRLVWINLQWKKRKYLCTLLMKLRSQLPSTLIGCLYSH